MTDSHLDHPPGDEPDSVLGSLLGQWRDADARWVVGFMRDQTRRSWLVPLLALPTAQLVTATEIPRPFLPLSDQELVEAGDLGRSVLAAADRVVASPGAELTGDEALTVLLLAMLYHELLGHMFFGLKGIATTLLGMPPILAGEGLVRRLARAIGERPEPPAHLAVLAAPMLDALVRDERGRKYLPQPHAFFTPIARAFDRRCYDLGLRTWADALRHAASFWTPDAWRGMLMSYAAGAMPLMMSIMEDPESRPTALPAESPAAEKKRRGKAARKRSDDRELNQLREKLIAAQTKAESARAAAAAVQLREAELVHARDRAQARVAELTARAERLERELREARGTLGAHLATLRRISEEDAPDKPEPQPVAVPPVPSDLLQGRTVFFFTGVARANVARAQADSLRALGALDIRSYEVRQGRPGPQVFPPGSVVIVDVRFVGHSQTEELEARVRRSDVIYLPLQAGEGGLAARVAERLRGRGEPLGGGPSDAE